MKYVCDAGSKTWFRFETPAEATAESRLMNHAVEKYFTDAYEAAARCYVPPKGVRLIEQKIGLKDYVQRAMPLFLTLRDKDGNGLATAMLPPGGKEDGKFRPIVVGAGNVDPFAEHGPAIQVLARHFGVRLDPARAYPYVRR